MTQDHLNIILTEIRKNFIERTAPEKLTSDDSRRRADWENIEYFTDFDRRISYDVGEILFHASFAIFYFESSALTFFVPVFIEASIRGQLGGACSFRHQALIDTFVSLVLEEDSALLAAIHEFSESQRNIVTSWFRAIAEMHTSDNFEIGRAIKLLKTMRSKRI